MNARTVSAILLGLLLVIQGQLWLGRGSVPDVGMLRTKLESQKEKNSASKLANDRLMAEVRDLKEGQEMVEEKARLELGMVKSNEIFVQYSR
jgi:cell division protein FtsB